MPSSLKARRRSLPKYAASFLWPATPACKAATRGDWNSVWENFDRRQKAKGEAANDAPAGEGDGDDMFKHAGVAAE